MAVLEGSIDVCATTVGLQRAAGFKDSACRQNEFHSKLAAMRRKVSPTGGRRESL